MFARLLQASRNLAIKNKVGYFSRLCIEFLDTAMSLSFSILEAVVNWTGPISCQLTQWGYVSSKEL